MLVTFPKSVLSIGKLMTCHSTIFMNILYVSHNDCGVRHGFPHVSVAQGTSLTASKTSYTSVT
jgi:hypothetical protein